MRALSRRASVAVPSSHQGGKPNEEAARIPPNAYPKPNRSTPHWQPPSAPNCRDEERMRLLVYRYGPSGPVNAPTCRNGERMRRRCHQKGHAVRVRPTMTVAMFSRMLISKTD